MDDKNTDNTPAQPGSSVAPQSPATPPVAPAPTAPVDGSKPLGTAANPSPQPAAFMNPAAPSTPAPKAPRNKKKLLTMVIAGVLVLVLGGGGAIMAMNKAKANKPENAVALAFARSVESKQAQLVSTLTMSSTSEDTTFSGDFGVEVVGDMEKKTYELKLSIGNIKAEPMDLSAVKVGVDVRMIQKDAYFKINNLTKSINTIYDEFVSLAGPELEAQYGPIKEDIVAFAEKITDKWVKIPSQEFEEGGYNCLVENNSLEFSKKDKDAIADAYKKNTFLVLKKKHAAETIDGVKSDKFTMNIDNTKANNFGKTFENLEYTRKVQECANTVAQEAAPESQDAFSSTDSLKDFDVWIGGSPKKLTKFSFPLEGDGVTGKYEGTLKYNGLPTVEAPTDAMEFDEFMALVMQSYEESSFAQTYGQELTPNSARLGTDLLQDFSTSLNESIQ